MAVSAARGQATTEAALGILVITTVIVFGIHFSEVSILSLKVQEAATSALWDTTAKRMHFLRSVTPDFSPRTAAVTAAGPEASTKYADFDGRASKAGSAPQLVFTQATPIAVTCTEDNASMPPLAVPGQIAAVFGATTQGGMSCTAQSNFAVIPGRFTRNFLQGSPFRVQQGTFFAYPICAAGRFDVAGGGGCDGRFVVALGDWGLTDGMENENCDVTAPGVPCNNQGYYLMAQEAFNANGNSRGSTGLQLSQWLYEGAFGGPAQQVREDAFFMAAVGENVTDPFEEPAPVTEHAGFGPYTVTPGGRYATASLQLYQAAWNVRAPCAFGLPCDPTTWLVYQ